MALSCIYPTEPDPGVNPELHTIAVGSGTRLEGGGLIEIIAAPSDTSYRLAPSRRVRAELVVSSGDAEVVKLFRWLCPPRPRSDSYFCHEFYMGLRPGFHVDELEERIGQIGGRYSFRGMNGEWATVALFDHEGLIRKARQVEAWSEVAFTEVAGATFVGGPPPFSVLSIYLPVDTGSAVPGDGIVQARSGDTVTVRYTQPSGELLSAQAVVP